MSDDRLIAALIDRPEDISTARSMGLQKGDLRGMAVIVYSLLSEMELDGTAITRETVQDILTKRNQDPVAEWVSKLPATKEGEAEFWAVSTITRGIKAQELEIAKHIGKIAKDEGADSEEHIVEYQRQLDRVSHRYVRMRNPVAENPAEELKKSKGWHIATGIPFIDRLIRLTSSGMHFVAGDPGSGKTTVGIQLATNALRDDIPVTLILAESDALEIKLGMLLLLQDPRIDAAFVSRVNYDPTFRTKSNIEMVEQAWLNNYHNAPLRIYEVSKGIDEVTSIVASTEHSIVIIDHAYAIVAQSDADHGIREHQQFMRLFTNVRKASQRNENIVVMMNQFKLSGREGGERGPDAQYGGSGVRNIADSIIHIWPDDTDLAHATVGTILVNAECHKVRARLVADQDGNPINPIGRRERFWLDNRYRMIRDELLTV